MREWKRTREKATPSPKDILKNNTRRNSSGPSGKEMAAAYNAQTSDGSGSGSGNTSGNTSGIIHNPQSVFSLGSMLGAGGENEEEEEAPREAASQVPEPRPEPLVAPEEKEENKGDLPEKSAFEKGVTSTWNTVAMTWSITDGYTVVPSPLALAVAVALAVAAAVAAAVAVATVPPLHAISLYVREATHS